MRIIGVLVLLAACGKSGGDYKAARAAYCDKIASNRQDLTIAFAGVEALGTVIDGTGPLLPACNEALSRASEGLGYLHGLHAGEGALYAGAPDSTADRAPFVVGSRGEDALARLAIERTELLVACEQNNRDAVKAWLARAKQAHKDVDARFEQQTKDCAAVAK
jgi:hypothetical protein